MNHLGKFRNKISSRFLEIEVFVGILFSHTMYMETEQTGQSQAYNKNTMQM